MRVRRVAMPVGLGLGIGACCATVAVYAVAATAAALSACRPHLDSRVEPPTSTAAPAQALDAPLFVVPGEEGSYGLFIRNVLVGRCELRSSAVEQRGHRLVRVTSLVASDGILDLVVDLHDEVSSLLDLDIGKPVETRGSFAGMLTGRPDPTASVDLPWNFSDHNGHSLLIALRGWDADAGTRAVTTLVVRGFAHKVDLEFTGRETLATALGRLPAVRIDGAIEHASSRGAPFHFVLWLADDWTRAVLRLDTETDFGEIASARIADYSAPGL